jgi:hypothetical protein
MTSRCTSHALAVGDRDGLDHAESEITSLAGFESVSESGIVSLAGFA